MDPCVESSQERRPGPFGLVRDLLPDGQVVLTAPHDAPASDAVELLINHGVAQAPVMRDGQPIGVFSWRSFGKRVSDLRHTGIKAATLPVGDCMEPACFIDIDAYIDTASDWSNTDYALVRENGKLVGLLSVKDIFSRLSEFAEAFVLLYEIEHDVRNLIHALTTETDLKTMIAAMGHDLNGHAPKTLEDFTFSQYRQLVCDVKSNWEHFARAFHSSREVAQNDFTQIGELRNVVFHFRRAVNPRDTDRLRRFRDSLRYDLKTLRERETAATEHGAI